MNGPQIKKALSMLALGLTFTVFGANQGCDVMVQSADPYWLYQDAGGGDQNKKEGGDVKTPGHDLTVTGSGEIVTLSAGHASFAARINWDSGQYFFAPDPEGKITGDRIICAVSIDSEMETLEGECFRSGHVCDFFYWEESDGSSDGKKVYSVGYNSCLEGGEIGPFLVPLDSPLCGQDPFPACPADDLFPTGVTPKAGHEDGRDQAVTEPIDSEEAGAVQEEEPARGGDRQDEVGHEENN